MQKMAYEVRISDWSSDVCSSELAVMEEFVEPRPAENRNLVLFVEVEQAGADHLGYRQHPVDGVAEKMGERVGIDAAQLEPQRCRLQDIALGGGEARCPNEVRIAGTVDENIRSIGDAARRSEEHTYELQSLMRISYAVFCLKNKNRTNNKNK